jgi:hypothetical protein
LWPSLPSALVLYDKAGPIDTAPPHYLRPARFSVGLGDGDDPVLAMRDASRWRIFLGAEQTDVAGAVGDDWGLSFRSRTNALGRVGTHGVNRERSQAYVVVRDERGASWTLPPNFEYEVEKVPLIPRIPRP